MLCKWFESRFGGNKITAIFSGYFLCSGSRTAVEPKIGLKCVLIMS